VEPRGKCGQPGLKVRIVLHANRRRAIIPLRRCAQTFAADHIEDTHMHASLAFVNGAGSKRRAHGAPAEREELRLLNTLLSSVNGEQPQPAGDEGKSQDGRQAEEDGNADTPASPGSFNNDPPDPSNPNEERERHLKKIKR
jgi:hypothetical protein